MGRKGITLGRQNRHKGATICHILISEPVTAGFFNTSWEVGRGQILQDIELCLDFYALSFSFPLKILTDIFQILTLVCSS